LWVKDQTEPATVNKALPPGHTATARGNGQLTLLKLLNIKLLNDSHSCVCSWFAHLLWATLDCFGALFAFSGD